MVLKAALQILFVAQLITGNGFFKRIAGASGFSRAKLVDESEWILKKRYAVAICAVTSRGGNRFCNRLAPRVAC